MLLTDTDSKSEMLFLTSSGILTGKPITDEKYLTDPNLKSYVDYSDSSCKKFKSDIGVNEGSLPGDQGVLLLQDVKLKNGAITINIPFLSLFFADIDAVSIGSFPD